MSENLIVIPATELQELLRTTIQEEIQKIIVSNHAKEDKPVVYRSREYVKNLLHTTYPTLNKYTKEGLLKPVYFGRRVLYLEDELNLSLPKIQALLKQNEKTAA